MRRPTVSGLSRSRAFQTLRQASQSGWAEVPGSIERFEADLRAAGRAILPGRPGQPSISTLRPVTSERAHRFSLSASYGRGKFPLHTDGAHLTRPPEFVVFEGLGDECNVTATVLWDIKAELETSRMLSDTFAHGTFVVGRGPAAFLAPAIEGSHLRYDPGCMRPLDRSARNVALHVENAWGRAHRVRCVPNKLLVIDNRRVVHGRESVTDSPNRRIRRLLVGPHA
jgi:hypothetical protein